MSPPRRLSIPHRTQTLWGYATGAVGASAAAAGVGIRAAIETFQEVLSANRVDFGEEGLLDGSENPDARRDLLRQLHAAGVPLDDLRDAVERDRLPLLPIEAVLRGEDECTLEELAADGDIDLETLTRRIVALGLGRPDRNSTFYGDPLLAAGSLKELQQAGVSEEGIDEICRVAGRSLLTLARGIREVFGAAFSEPGDSELDLGLRYAAAARRMLPVFEPLVRFTLTMQLLHLIRNDVVSSAELSAGALPGSREVAVCFADLTDFTGLGQAGDPERVADVVRRFENLVQAQTPRAARHVKTIGDAAMVVAQDTEVVLETALRLVSAAEEMDGRIPRIHAGVATGRAVSTHGDWYGQPVNLASRLAESAPPGCVYTTEEVRRSVPTDVAQVEFVGVRQPKGIGRDVRVFCLTPA